MIEMYIVLGRFQPFHNGHASLIEAALKMGEVCIAIGSSQAEMDLQNPWSAEEREAMIRAWLDTRQAKIVQIPDINDPPNWVEHAREFHGEGVLVSSDDATLELYNSANFPSKKVELYNRENLAGWRIRETARMVCTTTEEAIRTVLAASVPKSVIDWLIANDALNRLAYLSPVVERVG